MTRTQVIEKVRKILAKADPKRNPSKEEVEIAKNLADKILKKHGLSLGSVKIPPRPTGDHFSGTRVDFDEIIRNFWKSEANKTAKDLSDLEEIIRSRMRRGGPFRRGVSNNNGFGFKPEDFFYPPNHVNCRASTEPVTEEKPKTIYEAEDEEDEFNSIDIKTCGDTLMIEIDDVDNGASIMLTKEQVLKLNKGLVDWAKGKK